MATKSTPLLSNPQRDAVRDRRQTILAMLADGKTDEQIAQSVGIAKRTVVMHLRTFKIMLQAENRFEIVQRAVERGLVPPPKSGKPLTPVTLTPAEFQILQHLARERTRPEIARRTRSTLAAVRALIVNMKRKLRVRSRVALIDAASKLGLVPATWRRASIPNPLTERDVEIIRLLERKMTAGDIARSEGTAASIAQKAIERVRVKVRARRIASISRIAKRFNLIDSRGRRNVRVPAATPGRLWKLNPARELAPTLLKTLTAMCRSCESRELARRLRISVGSVGGRCHAVMRELGVTSRAEAVLRGVKLGLVDADRRSLRERLDLGERHWEVAKLMARGKSCGAIAEALGIEPGGAAAMQRNIRYKFGTSGRTATVQALRRAIAEDR